MRIVKLALIAAVALCAAACSQKSGALAPVKTDLKVFEAQLDALPNEHFVLKADAAADIAAIVAAAPKSMKISYATVTFDAASGATVINQLRIAPADQPDVGLSIDQLKVWGLDAKVATDRLTGLNLDATVRLARRIDATGVTPFGLDKFTTSAIGAYSDAVAGAVTSVAGDQNPEITAALAASDLQLKSYDIGIGRLILDDLYLRPWVLAPVTLSTESEWAEAMPFLQTYAAVYRSFAMDIGAVYDLKIAATFNQSGSDLSMAMLMKTLGWRGWRGGDIDMTLLRNVSMDMSQPGATVAPMQMAISERVGRGYGANMRTDKALGYLARGVMPPRTETDLISFGVTTIENLAMDINGHSFFSADRISYDFSHFRWFIPVKGRVTAQNVAYDIPGVLAFAEDAANMGGSSETEPVPTIPPAIIPILAKYGLDKPSMDFDFGWDWNPKTGAARIDTSYGLDGYDRYDIAADFVLPTFDGVSALLPETGEPETAAIGDLFSKTSALKSASFNLVDEGGLEKIFAVIIEIAKAMPDDDPSMGPLRALTPEGLRGMASSGAYMLADQAGAQMPAAKDWLRPFAAWVTEGGAVHATMKPKAPVVFSTYGEQVSSGAIAPEAALDAFNLSVTHEPPKGGAKKPN